MTDNVLPFTDKEESDWIKAASDAGKRTVDEIVADMRRSPDQSSDLADVIASAAKVAGPRAGEYPLTPDFRADGSRIGTEPQGHVVDPFMFEDTEPASPEELEAVHRRMNAKVLGEFPEDTKAKRYSADTRLVLGILLGLVALLAVASFSVSFAGLYAAAEWAVGPVPWLQIAVPLMLDIAIIAFTLALFVERERRERVAGTWIAIALFASVSAASNVLHTLTVTTATTLPQLIAGAVISGGAPLLLAFATDKIAVKVFRGAGDDE